MSAGWQWAYRALKDGVLSVDDVEHILYAERLFKKFEEEARRGMADYLEELADEKEIEEDQERQRNGRQGI